MYVHSEPEKRWRAAPRAPTAARYQAVLEGNPGLRDAKEPIGQVRERSLASAGSRLQCDRGSAAGDVVT